MKAPVKPVEPVKKGLNKEALGPVVSESQVLNWTVKGDVSQCPTLCIPLVRSWPLAKLQLNSTGQGLYLIKCLAPDLQLFCTARWHCCTSADCVLNYIDDILMYQHTCADRYVGENNRPPALAKVSEKTGNRMTPHLDLLFCASNL